VRIVSIITISKIMNFNSFKPLSSRFHLDVFSDECVYSTTRRVELSNADAFSKYTKKYRRYKDDTDIRTI